MADYMNDELITLHQSITLIQDCKIYSKCGFVISNVPNDY